MSFSVRPVQVLAMLSLAAAMGHAAALDHEGPAMGPRPACIQALDRSALVACLETLPGGGDASAEEVAAWAVLVSSARGACPEIPAAIQPHVQAATWSGDDATCVVWDDHGRLGALLVTGDEILAMPTLATVEATLWAL